jgi:transposase
MNAIQLTAAKQRQLEQTLHDTHDVRLYRRTLAVLEYSRGRSVKDIAQTLGVTRQSIHHWVVRFQHDGSSRALSDGPRPGRPRQADERVEALLQALMLISPQRCGYQATYWTTPLLCDQVSKHLRIDCCTVTLRRCLRRMGYRWKRPRYVLAPDPQREKKTPDSALAQPPAAA